MIENEEAFRQDCLQALEFTSDNNAFVTLGIKPTYANTGYGYIQFETDKNEESIHSVKRFTEKPDKETAIEFFKDGFYLWNSGIFIWKAADIVSAFRFHMPDMFDIFACGLIDFNTEKEQAAIKHIYSHCESISIDYAILEKAKKCACHPSFIWME